MAHPRGSMKRSTVLLTALLSACTVGEVPGGDGGGSGSGDNDRNLCENRVATVAPAHDHVAAPLGPRARSGCMDATGCHGPGGAGGAFAFAGTLYKETSAITPSTGATVRIFAVGGMKSLAEAVTDSAGNFVIRNPAMFTAFPYETHVTACGTSTTIVPMISPIAVADANCNAGGSCHGAAGTQGAVYLRD